MLIRILNNEDIDKTFELLKEHWIASNMNNRCAGFEEETAKKALAGFVDNSLIKCLVSELNNEIVGIVAFLIKPNLTDSREIVASEIMWYASKQIGEIKSLKLFMELYDRMNTLLLQNKVNTIHIGMSWDNKTLARYLIENYGFRETTRIYSKEVK